MFVRCEEALPNLAMSELEELSPLTFYAAFILTLLNLTLLRVDLRFLIEFANSIYGLVIGTPISMTLSSVGLLIDPQESRFLKTIKIGVMFLGFSIGLLIISMFLAKLVRLVQMFVRIINA